MAGSLLPYLPLLRGWDHIVAEHKPPEPPIVLPPGMRKTLIEKAEFPGWLEDGGVRLDNKNTSLVVKTDYWTVDCFPYGLYDSGFTIPPSYMGPWLTRYDETKDIYFIRAVMPGIPYKRMYHVYLDNPTVTVEGTPNTACTIVSYTFVRIEIRDVKEFKESLWEALYPAGIPAGMEKLLSKVGM